MFAAEFFVVRLRPSRTTSGSLFIASASTNSSAEAAAGEAVADGPAEVAPVDGDCVTVAAPAEELTNSGVAPEEHAPKTALPVAKISAARNLFIPTPFAPMFP